ELNILYSDPDLLKWAVTERNLHKAIGEPQKLVPLKSINFACSSDILASVCDDLFQAFEETLEEVSVSHSGGGEPLAELTIGKEWRPAPALRKMTIFGWLAIITHPDAFTATPALEQLQIADGGQSSEHDLDVDKHISLSIWDLPKLWRLSLTGYAADNFDPRSFAYMSNLRSVQLGDHIANSRYFLPRPGSSADIQMQLWTWDIALPQLADLTLTGHHALRFRFHFVTLCPSLITLHLDVGGHRVVLSDGLDVCLDKDTATDMNGQQKQNEGTDLSSNNNNNNKNVSGDHSCVSTVSRSLRTLNLHGRFVISDEALTLMLAQLFPLLDKLTMYSCKRYTIEKLVELAETHRRLDYVITTHRPTKQQVQALRLERPRRIPKRYRTASRHLNEIEYWYNRYEKAHFEYFNGSPPPTTANNGRHMEMLPPFCIYQMGSPRWEHFRRSFHV
ncbi:hypothetical protein BGZ73_001348, partial [Actinomortierella ambigua]